MANPSRPRRWLIPVLIVGALVLLAAGVGLGLAVRGSDEPLRSAAAGTPTAAPASPKDTSGQKACDAIKKTNVNGGSLTTEPAVLAGVAVDGRNSTNPFVKGAAEELAVAAKAAVAARGTDDAVMRTIELGTAALNFETTCIQQWYYPRP